MDTMFFTKVLGGFCGALLILLLVNWASEAYYHPSAGHGEHAEAAYAIETDEGPVEEVVEVPFAEILATADLAAGQRSFNKCKACHKIGEGEHGTGPSMFHVVGRTQGGTDFGSYSGSFPGGEWTVDALNDFLENPRGYAPGTTMGFQGFPKVEERANVIAYLSTL